MKADSKEGGSVSKKKQKDVKRHHLCTLRKSELLVVTSCGESEWKRNQKKNVKPDFKCYDVKFY